MQFIYLEKNLNNLKRNKMKETLEEAAENNWDKINNQYKEGLNPYAHRVGFIEGANWQQERMYSEEEVQLILSKLLTDIKNGNAGNSVEWFEQFKKK